MRVLLISPLPPPEGGIATWTVKYLDYCKKNGVSVDLVNIANTGSRGKKIIGKINIKDEITRTSKILFSLRGKLKDKKFDVVHLNTSCSKFGLYRDFFCARMASKARVPVILHCHCNIEDQLQSRAIAIALFSRIVFLSSKVIVLSQQSFSYVKELGFDKTIILPNFIEVDKIIASKAINNTIKTVLFVGHFQPSKGAIEILKAAKMIPALHFILIGPISDKLTDISFPDNVLTMGSQNWEIIQKNLDKADVFLLPSYTEGFSISLLEAMARGLPVITTEVGANKEMIEQSGGILVPVGNADAIVTALESLLSYQVRKEMSDWNINKVKNSYQIDLVMEQFLHIYKEVSSDVL